MIAAADLADIFADHAEWCEVQAEGENAPRNVCMVAQAFSSGNIDSRNKALSFIDKSTIPRGADWGYGLMWAADAPADMNAESKLTITDSAGQVYTCEAARPVYDLDADTRKKVCVAWRLALRGKQRMVRGGR